MHLKIYHTRATFRRDIFMEWGEGVLYGGWVNHMESEHQLVVERSACS